jgi:type IV pilus assembly protein PilB
MEEKTNRIVDELLKNKLATKDQIDKALEESKRTGVELGKVLVSGGIVEENQFASLKADLLGVPFVDLKGYIVDPEVIHLIPEEMSRRSKLVPLFKIKDTLTVAMAEPKDVSAIDELQRKTGLKSIDTVLSSEADIFFVIDHYYGKGTSVEEAVKDVTELKTEVAPEEEVEARVLEQMAEEAPVVRIVNLLVIQALRERASDIHIEPAEENVNVRLRIDGVLHNIKPLPKQVQGAVISRIKILAKMDIAEKRKPQDGRIEAKAENKTIDLRVSTYPTSFGENVVIRLLDKTSFLLGMSQLGFSGKELARFEKIIRRPYGIILVTGPTGSGKTTTLYAALNSINTTEKNIITIEDPIEYQLPLIRQSQINPKAGLTFATGLRSILRQDPDIIMVGEIRDIETAEIAIHSALTGHLVLSTLHTNDAAGALTRLEDMGVEPFLVASSVTAILAQRLVRLLCEKCREAYEPSAELLKDLGIAKEKLTFYRPKGCKYCDSTGYKGRIAIFELLTVSEEIKKLILAKASSGEIKELARREGMSTLWEDGLNKIKAGITSPEEVVRVTREETIL